MRITLSLLGFLFASNVGAVEWLELRSPDTGLLSEVGNDQIIAFDDKTLRFNYFIERSNPADRKPGAILVRVEKRYADGSPTWPEGLRNTIYWRNFFPEPAEHFGDNTRQTLRSTFERFHTHGAGSIELRNDFHAAIPPSWKSSEPDMRLQSFRFADPDDDRSIQSVKLLYYSGIRASGTRIPFDVIAQDAFEEITITVVELNPLPGTLYAPKTVKIVNARQ